MASIQNIKNNLVAILLLVNIACGTYVGNPEEVPTTDNTENPDDTGAIPSEYDNQRIVISIADAPIDNLTAVYVKINEIAVKSSDEQWINLEMTSDEAINLLDYQDGNRFVLGISESLPAGSYSEIRLILDESNPISGTNIEGETVEIKAPSATSSGIKLKIDFEILEAEQTAITLDFDLRQSIKSTGNKYTLQPVIRPSKDKESSVVKGSSEADIVCIYEAGQTGDSDENCETAVSSTKIKNGEYIIPFIPEGSYYIRFFSKDGNFIDGEEFNVTADD